MESYYEPDSRWELFGVTDIEKFQQMFVVKGYFHDGVPKDIKDAFITIEYLMAHSYYYWPMYDEAFNAVLRLLEMAIKQKAILQNIKLKGKSYAKLISEICTEPYQERLRANFNRARSIRNDQVHAERNSFSGAMGNKGNNFKLFISILNELFRDDNWQKVHFEKQQAIGGQLLPFKDSLMVFENKAPGILVSGILDFKIFDDTLFIILNPVIRNTKQALEEHRYPNLFFIALAKYRIQAECLIGASEDGQEVKIYRTDKVENVLQFENHLNGLKSVSIADRALCETYIQNEASWNIVELEYNYLSKNLN